MNDLNGIRRVSVQFHVRYKGWIMIGVVEEATLEKRLRRILEEHTLAVIGAAVKTLSERFCLIPPSAVEL